MTPEHRGEEPKDSERAVTERASGDLIGVEATNGGNDERAESPQSQQAEAGLHLRGQGHPAPGEPDHAQPPHESTGGGEGSRVRATDPPARSSDLRVAAAWTIYVCECGEPLTQRASCPRAHSGGEHRNADKVEVVPASLAAQTTAERDEFAACAVNARAKNENWMREAQQIERAALAERDQARAEVLSLRETLNEDDSPDRKARAAELRHEWSDLRTRAETAERQRDDLETRLNAAEAERDTWKHQFDLLSVDVERLQRGTVR